MSRDYWRSLAQIDDRPEYRTALEREFPEGASELPEGVSRREMMMLLGASMSLAGVAGCRRPVEEIVPFVTAPEEMVPGIPRYYATTMPFRRSAYGLIVESHEGRPTKVEGNPVTPFDPRGVELPHPGLGARPLRSRPLAIGDIAGHAKVLERFRDGLGPAVRGARLRWRRRPGNPLRVLLLSHPGTTGGRARVAGTPGCSGRPTTPSATRTDSQVCVTPRGATSISCSGSIGRR